MDRNRSILRAGKGDPSGTVSAGNRTFTAHHYARPRSQNWTRHARPCITRSHLFATSRGTFDVVGTSRAPMCGSVDKTMKIVVFGLSVTSAWGNGHATTFRALLEALYRRGHDIVFSEKDLEWYASNRDLPEPSFCRLRLYDSWSTILTEVKEELASADVGLVGSYCPDGVAAIDELLCSRAVAKAFYDIDTPITIAGLRDRGETEYLKAEQISGFDVYFSFTGGSLLQEIKRAFGARSTVPLYCSFDPVEYRRFGRNKRFACDLSYMGTYAADRQAKLEEFLVHPAEQSPAMNFIVAGPQYP